MTEELKAYVVISLAPGPCQELRPLKVYLNEKDAVDETVRLALEAKETKSGYTFSGSEVQLVAPEIDRLRAALDARDRALRAASAKGHRQGCPAKARYLHGECTCSWMLEHAATIEAALAAAKESK